MFLHRFFVKLSGFTLFDSDGVLGTLPEASTQSVAIHLTDQLRLPVYNLDGALSARGNTQPAAVAFFFIYFDDLPYVHFLLLFQINGDSTFIWELSLNSRNLALI
jgi:hypothetical protein